jgi:hypothetical protein
MVPGLVRKNRSEKEIGNLKGPKKKMKRYINRSNRS